MNGVGQTDPFSSASEYNSLSFIIARALDEVQTVSIVKVAAVNTGALTVDVQVLVNLVTGAGIQVPHGVISARPYFRAQGGTSGIILDPVAGDIGVMVFASRDSTAVISAKGVANPGSQRRFSWSDGIYYGGILNTAPTQYIQFAAGGINIVSPTAVNITSPDNTVNGPLNVTGLATFEDGAVVDGNLMVTATVLAMTVSATTVNATNLDVSGGSVSLPAGSITSADLAATGVTPGSYTATNLTVGADGRITAAANGTGGAGITSIASPSATITVTNPTGPTVDVDLANTAVTAGTYTYPTITVDARGRLTSATNGATPLTSISIATGTGLTGGPLAASGSTVSLSTASIASLALANTALQSISIATGTGLSGGPLGASGSTVSLGNTAVSAGTYTYATITVDAQGRITSAASGATPLTTVSVSDSITGNGTGGSPLLLSGDAASPGNNQYYGTSTGGVKGWYAVGAIPSPAAPGTIPDLIAWWASDNILGTAGLLVPRFQERTPWITGVFAVSSPATTASSPTIDSNTLNSLPIVKWPASSPTSVVISNPLNMIPGNATFFVVVKPNTAVTAGGMAILGANGNGGLALYLNGASSAKLNLTKTGIAVIGTSTATWSSGTAFQANATYSGTTGAYAFRQARAAAGSGTGATAAGSTQITWIGADQTSSGANLLSHSIAELIVYQRVLSNTEITTIENYLNTKWGV